MSDTDLLGQIGDQEEKLVLPAFNEHVAFDLGLLVRKRAVEQGLPIVVDVRSFDRQLFFAALPGASFNNCEWARRKSNTVRRFQKSTLRIVLERGGEGVFPPQVAADPVDYVIAGGGFPIKVTNAGMVGSIAVSGLLGRNDHDLAVGALCDHLGLSADASVRTVAERT